MPSALDIPVGTVFTRLTVTANHIIRGKSRYVACVCVCGTQKIIRLDGLISGAVKSCGCFQKDLQRERRTTHNHSRSRTYRSWQAMHNRCYNRKYSDYHNYGGRGIAVCPRWDKFENFLEDMGERPKGLDLDRTDNSGNYCKENCRWVTKAENNRNKRTNVLLAEGGKALCLVDFAKAHSISYEAFRTRFRRRGWSLEASLKEVKDPRRYLSFRGETHCLAEWARIAGLSEDAIRQRIKAGWAIERVLTTPSRRKHFTL